MKLYFPSQHYNKAFRGHVFPLLKPFLKNEGFTDAARQEMYGISEKDVEFVATLAAADVAVLTMSWNYYYLENKLEDAQLLIEAAQRLDKTVWTVNIGDVGVSVPDVSNIRVFRMSGFVSQLAAYHEGLPVFIEDPLLVHYDSPKIIDPVYTSLPIVGFCGYAEGRLYPTLKHYFKAYLKAIKSLFFTSIDDVNPVFIAPKFRSHCLQLLEKSSGITTHFIRRSQYRAGVQTITDRQRSTQVFFDNMAASQYVLCVRGAGNFSVRLYETLAMGRIPVYVHTGGFLPLQDVIDWKQHMVWVEVDELGMLADKVIEFHEQLDADGLKALCKANRQLWETSLRLKGFFDAL